MDLDYRGMAEQMTREIEAREGGAAVSTLTSRARALAERTRDAYSADRYRSWTGAARAILAAGYCDEDAEIILRSKVMRWAADGSDAAYGRVPTSAIENYLASTGNQLWIATYLLVPEAQ